jgi:hypothetical protein
MAITDYAGLVEGVQKWCARSDTTFTNRIPDFVAMAEDRIYNGADLEMQGPLYSPPLRSSVLEVTDTLTFVAGEATLPQGFLGARKLFRSGDRIGLVYQPPERFAVRSAYSSGGDPAFFTIEAGILKLNPSYDGDLEVTYWSRLAALTVEASSNALLLAHPMIYLSATLFEAFSFVQEPDLALGHVTRLRAAVDGANKTANAIRISGASLRVQPRNFIP